MNHDPELISLLQTLIRIDSVNPDLVAGGAGEAQVAAAIEHWARAAGLRVETQLAAPGRPNVIVTAPGRGGGRNLMFNGHIDVVGVGGMTAPWEPRIEGGRMHGRGSYDMKCGVAASLITARRALAMGLRGDVSVSCVADEEVASIGTQAVCRELARWKPDAVIVTEPTEMTLIIAHKGFVWFDVVTHGVAAHGSRPQLGVDAIAKMGRFLMALERHGHELAARAPHELLGCGSIHASIIQGGQELSSYPAECRLQIERRTLPGETPERVEAELRALLAACAAEDPAFKATLTRGLDRSPFGIGAEAELVRLCGSHLGRITAAPVTISGASYWADTGMFAAAGLPTLLLGPSGHGAHGHEEWVDLDSVQQCVELYGAIARDFCG